MCYWPSSSRRSRPAAGCRAIRARCRARSCAPNKSMAQESMALVSLINADRLWTRLMALAEIGAAPAGGVNRQALSDGEIAAWHRVIAWAKDARLTASTDAAGNLFLTLAGRDRAALPLLVGSHLDSQPTGGKFDGGAGVMAALEVVISLAEHDAMPARDHTLALRIALPSRAATRRTLRAQPHTVGRRLERTP